MSKKIPPTFWQEVQSYQTPPGKIDVPYVYVFDASQLTDGATYNNLGVVIDHDSEFILRRVVGLDLVLNPNATGAFLGRYQDQMKMQQSPIRPGLLLDGTTRSGMLPVLPEGVFKPASKIGFELHGVLRNFTADTVPISNAFIGFAGMRRFDVGGIFMHATKYSYRELPYTYSYDLNLNWSHWTDAGSGTPTNPHNFNIPIDEDDFELSAIGVTNLDGALVTTNDFQLSLWDASKAQQFSSLPLNLPYFNWNGPKQYGRPVYPVPPIVYPIRGILQFSVVSMLPFGTTGSYRIHFMGIKRRENQ